MPYIQHVLFICVTRLVHMCDVIYLCAWGDSLICVTCRSHTHDTLLPHTSRSLVCRGRRRLTCNMPRPYISDMRRHFCMWHDSLIYDTCDMTHSYMIPCCHVSRGVLFNTGEDTAPRVDGAAAHDGFHHLAEPCSEQMWMSRLTYMNESRHTLTCIVELCHACEWVTSHTWMGHVTHSHTWMSHVTHTNESRQTLKQGCQM